MSFVVLIIVMSPIFVLLAVSRNHQRQIANRSATIDVFVDAAGAHRTLADGRRESVTWDEVTEIDVFTARVGPHEAAGGAVVLYGDATRGCIIPLDKVAESSLFDHVHRLPGIDVNALVKAVAGDGRAASVDQRRPGLAMLLPRPLQVTTVVWTRDADGARDGEREVGAGDTSATDEGPEGAPSR